MALAMPQEWYFSNICFTCSLFSLRCFLFLEAGPFVKLWGSFAPPPLGGDAGLAVDGGGRADSKCPAAALCRFDGSCPSRLSWSAISLPAKNRYNKEIY